jgi:site-specific DNA-methyltransferase (adenine-specific)
LGLRSNPEEVVLDPFCGSATTGVAAILNGRKFIGIDADETYLEKYSIPRLIDAEQDKNSRIF